MGPYTELGPRFLSVSMFVYVFACLFVCLSVCFPLCLCFRPCQSILLLSVSINSFICSSLLSLYFRNCWRVTCYMVAFVHVAHWFCSSCYFRSMWNKLPQQIALCLRLSKVGAAQESQLMFPYKAIHHALPLNSLCRLLWFIVCWPAVSYSCQDWAL